MAKKYGKPYGRKNLLRKGDIIEISNITPYAYSTVVKMLDGDRLIQPEVLAAAEKLVNERESKIKELSN